MTNPYHQPPDPYGGHGAQQPYGAPPYQQPQPGSGYGQPFGQPPQQPYAPPPAPAQNSAATASAVLGFLAILTTCWGGGLLALAGLGAGIAGLKKSQQTGVGRSLSIGGIVLNALALLIQIAFIVFAVVASRK